MNADLQPVCYGRIPEFQVEMEFPAFRRMNSISPMWYFGAAASDLFELSL